MERHSCTYFLAITQATQWVPLIKRVKVINFAMLSIISINLLLYLNKQISCTCTKADVIGQVISICLMT